MESEALCIPCVIKQCQRIALQVSPLGKSEALFIKATKLAMDLVGDFSLKEPPSIFTSRIIIEVYKLLNNPDPFAAVKREMQELGRKASEKVRKIISASLDPFHTAIKFAGAGNVIDIGPQANFSLEKALENISFTHDDYPTFKEKLKGAEKLLYILDNAGEIYFDRLLVETLSSLIPKITMVVKEKPILNDATMAEAKEARLFELGEVITTGSGFLGVNFEEVSERFSEEFASADIVLAKGHANFESLVDCERDAFFILKAKCPVVADRLGVKVGDSVFYYSPVK